MSLEHSPIRQRGPGRPRRADTPQPPPQPPVFVTREQLAMRWHCSPHTITRNARKLGIRPTYINGRWLAALAEVERVERERTAGGGDAA